MSEQFEKFEEIFDFLADSKNDAEKLQKLILLE